MQSHHCKVFLRSETQLVGKAPNGQLSVSGEPSQANTGLATQNCHVTVIDQHNLDVFQIRSLSRVPWLN